SSFGPGAGERWGGCSVELVVTHTVRDSAAILDVVAGPMPGDPYTAPPPVRPFVQEVGADPGRLRVGLMRIGPRQTTVHADCIAAVDTAARALEDLGHVVEEAYPAAFDDNGALSVYVTIVACCTARALDAWGEKVGRKVGPDDVEALTWALAEMARSLPVTRYVEASESMHTFGRRMAGWARDGGGDFDLLR